MGTEKKKTATCEVAAQGDGDKLDIFSYLSPYSYIVEPLIASRRLVIDVNETFCHACLRTVIRRGHSNRCLSRRGGVR